MNRLTLPVLMLLPALIIIVGLVGYPLVRTIYLSFTDTGLGELIYGGSTWVGLENFKEVFTDEHLRISLINTVVFGTVCVIGTMALGFAVALLLNQRLKGNVFFSIAVLLPWAVPAIAASAIFKWLFDSRYGFVNWALVQLGFEGFHGLRLVRRPRQRLRGDLRHRRLAVVPVHRAAACSRACRRSPRNCCTPPPSTAPARGAASGWSRSRCCGRSSPSWSSSPRSGTSRSSTRST